MAGSRVRLSDIRSPSKHPTTSSPARPGSGFVFTVEDPTSSNFGSPASRRGEAPLTPPASVSPQPEEEQGEGQGSITRKDGRRTSARLASLPRPTPPTTTEGKTNKAVTTGEKAVNPVVARIKRDESVVSSSSRRSRSPSTRGGRGRPRSSTPRNRASTATTTGGKGGGWKGPATPTVILDRPESPASEGEDPLLLKGPEARWVKDETPVGSGLELGEAESDGEGEDTFAFTAVAGMGGRGGEAVVMERQGKDVCVQTDELEHASSPPQTQTQDGVYHDVFQPDIPSPPHPLQPYPIARPPSRAGTPSRYDENVPPPHAPPPTTTRSLHRQAFGTNTLSSARRHASTSESPSSPRPIPSRRARGFPSSSSSSPGLAVPLIDVEELMAVSPPRPTPKRRSPATGAFDLTVDSPSTSAIRRPTDVVSSSPARARILSPCLPTTSIQARQGCSDEAVVELDIAPAPALLDFANLSGKPDASGGGVGKRREGRMPFLPLTDSPVAPVRRVVVAMAVRTRSGAGLVEREESVAQGGGMKENGGQERQDEMAGATTSRAAKGLEVSGGQETQRRVVRRKESLAEEMARAELGVPKGVVRGKIGVQDEASDGEPDQTEEEEEEHESEVEGTVEPAEDEGKEAPAEETPAPEATLPPPTPRRLVHPSPRLNPVHSTPHLVEITSTDPRAAARAAAILKVHHRYIQRGWVTEGDPPLDEEDFLGTEVERSVRQERQRSVRAEEPGSTRERTREGSAGTSAKASYRPDFSRWGKEDWRRLERTLIRMRAAEAVEEVAAEKVADQMLKECRPPLDAPEWSRAKMVRRVIALQRRRAGSTVSTIIPSLAATPEPPVRQAVTRPRAPTTQVDSLVRRQPPAAVFAPAFAPPTPDLFVRPTRPVVPPSRSVPSRPVPVVIEEGSASTDTLDNECSADASASSQTGGRRRRSGGDGKVWRIINRFEDEEDQREEESRRVEKLGGGGSTRKRTAEGGQSGSAKRARF